MSFQISSSNGGTEHLIAIERFFKIFNGQRPKAGGTGECLERVKGIEPSY